MGAVWMCARSQLRARRRAIVALGLLLGLMSGAATAAAVGARRTETAYPRFFERYHPYDVSVSTGGRPDTDQIFEKIARLPQVRLTSRASLYFGTVGTDAGKEVTFPDVFLISPQGPGLRPTEYKIVSGRDLDPDRDDEVLANYAMAERLGLRPDDRITISLMSSSEEGDGGLPPSDPIRVRVVGVIAYLGGFESATGGGFPTVFYMSPAFGERWIRYRSGGEDTLSVALRRGEDDADAFERELAARNIPTDGPPNRASSLTKGVQDLNRVPAIALWLLCGFLALTTLAVFSQLIARETQLAARDAPVLRGIGLSQRELFELGVIRAGAIALVGAVAGAGVAILLSPLTPVGLARIAEPDPGFTGAPGTLAAGGGITLGLILLASLAPAWIGARDASRSRPAIERRSSIAGALSRIGVPASMRSGVGLAVEPGRGERAVPVRTAALGMTIAIGALAAALGFAFSLQKLIGTPRLAGYAWDAGAIGNAFSAEEMAATLPRLQASIARAMPAATTWRGTVFLRAAVEHLEISAYVSDGPGPAIIEGREPRGVDEVTLDPRTMRQLRKRVGDALNVANVEGEGKRGPNRRMTIVGTFAVPRVAFQPSLPGQGVAFTPAAAIALNPGAPPADTVFVRFDPKTDFDRGLSILRGATRENAFTIVNRTQSATVGNVARMSELPLVLGAIVGLLGAATLAHALTTTVRRRRRDLAILKTLGFVRRQLRGTVAWQCTTLIVLALVVGVPLGIASGRWGWRLFAAQLQVVPVPVGAWAAGLGIPLATLALGNLIAIAPARAAARTPAAVVLRTE